MSKPCCGIQPKVMIDYEWTCSECNSVFDPVQQEQLDFYGYLPALPVSTPRPIVCDCGASKTINPNCHVDWCSTVKTSK